MTYFSKRFQSGIYICSTKKVARMQRGDADSRQQGARSKEQGARSKEQGARSNKQQAASNQTTDNQRRTSNNDERHTSNNDERQTPNNYERRKTKDERRKTKDEDAKKKQSASQTRSRACCCVAAVAWVGATVKKFVRSFVRCSFVLFVGGWLKTFHVTDRRSIYVSITDITPKTPH